MNFALLFLIFNKNFIEKKINDKNEINRRDNTK